MRQIYDKVVFLLIAPDKRRYNIVEVKSWLEANNKYTILKMSK